MTSILRTYYIAKQEKSPDVSYDIMQLGRCTLAEMTAGILVSCLPTMPKFYKLVSSKIYETLSSITKSGVRSGANVGIADQDKRPAIGKRGGRDHSEMQVDAQCQLQTPGKYITLGSLGSFSGVAPMDGVATERLSTMEEGPPTRRQDLEAGYRSA